MEILFPMAVLLMNHEANKLYHHQETRSVLREEKKKQTNKNINKENNKNLLFQQIFHLKGEREVKIISFFTSDAKYTFRLAICNNCSQACSQKFFLAREGGFNVEQLLTLEIFNTPKDVLPSSMLFYHIKELPKRHGNGELS